MAKAAQKAGQVPEQQPEQQPTTTQTSTETSSAPLDNEPEDKLAKEQTDFIDNFDLDEDNLGEDAFEEGRAVPAPKTTQPAEAQPTAAPAVPAQTPAAQPAQQPAEPPKAPAQQPAQAQPQTQQPAPAQASTTPQQPSQAQGEEPAAPVQPTSEQIQARYKEWRGQTENLLATHHFALTEQEQNDLELNPGEVIPRLMSKVYLDAVTATLSQVVNYLPRMIASVNESQTVQSKSEEEFFGRWPQLKDHKDMVLRVGQVYRQLNPRASKEDFMNEVGAQTLVALRIPPEGIAPQPKVNGNTQAQQTAKATPFVPAATAPGGGAPQQPPRNIFDQLASDFEEEELDEG